MEIRDLRFEFGERNRLTEEIALHLREPRSA